MASMFSRMACRGRWRRSPTRELIGSHQAPRPSITRPCPSGPGPAISQRVLHVAAITAGLRVQIGSTPDPTRVVSVPVRRALIMATQSLARRVSACQISVIPCSSAYRAISNS